MDSMALCATRFCCVSSLLAPGLGLLALSAVAVAAERQPAGSNANSLPIVTDAKLGGDERQTRFIADLSRKIEMRTFTLADPYRVVIDLPQVTFRLGHRAGESGRGLVKAFRYGLIMQGTSRIVLDLGKPARIERAFVLDAAEGQPARLVVDLVAADRESFLRTIASAKPPLAPEWKRPPQPSAMADPRPLIVIDPGHGGIDHGTRAPSGESEKTLVLDFALHLRDHIEKSGKYRVLMTRTDDTFVPLGERVRLARSNQAALFVSIHADALRRGDGEAQGATIYTLSETASDAEAARLAEAENRADLIAGIDLSAEPEAIAGILIDFAQRETRAYALQFARLLAAELKSVARLHKQPLKSAGFKVLKAPDVPSVLLELGYVSNQQDLKQLTSDSWRTKTAAAAARAIEQFLQRRFAAEKAK
jgi:N-acetylmuramoyl-L-alanine amidase